MKPISKTFKFMGDKTLKVRTDGRYEWCGKLLGRDECVVLDAAILMAPTRYDGGTELRHALQRLLGRRLFRNDYRTYPYSAYGACDQAARFVRRNWVWIKGS